MEGRKSSSSPRSETRHPTSSPVHPLWLLYNFTRTDIKTIVIPQTLFGIATALSGYHLASTRTQQQAPSLTDVLRQIPAMVLWLWLNLLIFTLANQRLPSSITEDAINKPWRNLPSKAITAASARRLLAVTVILSWALSVYWNVWAEFAALGILTWIYNDLGGADEHFLVRNFLNAGGYIYYGLGSLKLAANEELDYFQIFHNRSDVQPAQVPPALSEKIISWTLLTGLVVATTIQVQDLQDQTGDRARDRKTFPLIWGDRTCRWSVAGGVTFWSVSLPLYWDMRPFGYVLTAAFALILVARVLYAGYDGWTEGSARAREDEKTFLFWCLWLAMIYFLPVIRSREVGLSSWIETLQASSSATSWL